MAHFYMLLTCLGINKWIAHEPRDLYVTFTQCLPSVHGGPFLDVQVRTTQKFSDTFKLKLWQMETVTNATISGGRNRNYQSNCARLVRASLQSVPLMLSKLAFPRPNRGRACSEVVHQRPYWRFSVQSTLKQLQSTLKQLQGVAHFYMLLTRWG